MKRVHTLALAASAAAIVLTSGGFAAQHAFAATDTTTEKTLVERISERFNLNKTDVQAVVDEAHAARHAEMQAKVAERLTQAVTDGKITQAQKDLITTKQAEVQKKMDEIRAMTDETARKEALKTLREETQKWATDNNIAERWIGPMGGKGGHGGAGRGGMMRADDGMDKTVQN
jgi:hypothetical protein